MRDRIWATLCNYQYKGFVTELLYCKYQKYERNINVFLAVMSSGSIATWAIWKKLDLLWASLIALSQLITAIRPYFQYHKYVKELGSKSLKSEYLNIEFERLWDYCQRDKISEEEIEDRYYALKQEGLAIFRFSDEIIFDISKDEKLSKKADEMTLQYLKNNYNN